MDGQTGLMNNITELQNERWMDGWQNDRTIDGWMDELNDRMMDG